MKSEEEIEESESLLRSSGGLRAPRGQAFSYESAVRAMVAL